MSDTVDAQPTTDDVPDADDDLAARVDRLEGLAEDANRKAARAQDRVLSLREENRDLRDTVERQSTTIESLEAEVQELRQRTDLLEVLRDSDAMSVEERAALCIQSLYNEAYREQHKDTADAAAASMDYNKAKGVFRGEITRDRIYRTFDRADELVDDQDVVEYIEEDRSAPKNSRLVLSLEGGDVPPTIAGHEIQEPEV